MAAPAFFRDFNKPVDAVLKDDYTDKKNLKVKFTTSNGIAITSENLLEKETSLVASVSGKYKHAPSGFSVDKLALQKDGKVQAEVSLAGVAPGLNFTFKGAGSGTGDIGLEYTKPHFAVKSELDISLEKSKSSAVFAYEGAKVGGEVNLNLPNDKKSFEVGGWNAGVAYSGPQFFTSVNAANGKGGVDSSVFALYTLSSPLKVAARVNKPAAGGYGFTVGGTYKCNPKTTVKAKVDLGGSVSATVVQDALPKVTLTASTSVPIKSPGDYKVGFGAVLG